MKIVGLITEYNPFHNGHLYHIEKAKEIITRFGGVVTEVEDGGKKRLAYEIQKMREGFYYFIQFDAPATCPAEVEKRVRILDNVIRYLCVRKDA